MVTCWDDGKLVFAPTAVGYCKQLHPELLKPHSRGLNFFQSGLFAVPFTILVQRIWHNGVENYLGPCIIDYTGTVEARKVSEGGEERYILDAIIGEGLKSTFAAVMLRMIV